MLTAVASPGVLLLAVLAVWRVTHLFWGEDGPADLIVRVRRLAGNGSVGRMMDCFYCLSMWVAIPFAFAIGGAWPERVIAWFGLSGGAILLERLTSERSIPAPPPLTEREDRNVVLR
jgi:hypothetical protein